MKSVISFDLVHAVVGALRSVVGPGAVPLHEPSFEGHEWDYVKECLDSTFVSSVGSFVDRFERELAAFTGAEHAVAVVNGTAALQVALRLAGVAAGDEVLVPALTFVGTTNAVAHAGAVPHFVDCEENTLGLDPAALRKHLTEISEIQGGLCTNKNTGRILRAVVPMHTFGHPVDLDALASVCKDFRLVMVEDAAESLGSSYGGRHTGNFGALGIISFNGNKTITTGGGGAIITNSAELARHAKHLTTTARIPHRWTFDHDEIGYNYRMPNLNAALGCAQLEKLPQLLEAKRKNFEAYSQAFAEIPRARIVAEPVRCRSNYWLNTIILAEDASKDRDSILAAANDEGIMTRPPWTLMHRLTPYAGCPRADLKTAESLADRLINIPSSAHLLRRQR